MVDVRIATRGSRLARIQSTWVGERLSGAHPGLTFELVEITTVGDRDRTSPVTELTEMGAFVRSVQRAVLDGRADVAVHSAKDLPVDGPGGLVAVHPIRVRPFDVLCGATLDELPCGATVGTGSPRRAAQLEQLRPDITVADIRGNVDTRLEAVDAGSVHAVVLAEAGLARLGRLEAIGHRFPIEQMVPAPGQGALTVEAATDTEAAVMLAAIDDPAVARTVGAERLLLARTGAGCRSAFGALATEGFDGTTIAGFVRDERGPRRASVTRPTPADAVEALLAALDLDGRTDS